MRVVHIVGCASQELVEKIAQHFDTDVIGLNLCHFADTETVVCDLLPLEDSSILLVHQFIPCIQKSINAQLFELLLVLYQLKAARVQEINLFMPYLAYSRHDKLDAGQFCAEGEITAKMYNNAGVTSLYCYDVHSLRVQDFFALNFQSLTVTNFWREVIQKIDLSQEQWCLASPDQGGADRVQSLAEKLDVPFVLIEKERVATDESVALHLEGNVQGKTVVVLDDILDTGITAVNSANLLLEHGAQRVLGCFTHGVLSSGSVERLDGSDFEKIYVADTLLIDQESLSEKFEIVTMNDFMAHGLKEILK